MLALLSKQKFSAKDITLSTAPLIFSPKQSKENKLLMRSEIDGIAPSVSDLERNRIKIPMANIIPSV